MRALADWLEKQRKDATQDFALGPERLARMLKTTELANVPISELEKIGRSDMKRHQEALHKACPNYAQATTDANCMVKTNADRQSTHLHSSHSCDGRTPSSA